MSGINGVRLPVPTEDEEQMQLFRWAELQKAAHPELALLFHIPNGGSRGKAEAGRFRAMGVKAGVPDIFLPAARGAWHGLFVEMKRVRGGRVSPEQRAWLADLEAQGYCAVVCWGWNAARKEIMEYLRTEADADGRNAE